MNQVHQITCQWLIRPPTSSKCCITCNKYSFCYNNRLHFIKLKSTRWNYCTFVYNSVLFTADLKFILPIGINLKVSSSYLTKCVFFVQGIIIKAQKEAHSYVVLGSIKSPFSSLWRQEIPITQSFGRTFDETKLFAS